MHERVAVTLLHEIENTAELHQCNFRKKKDTSMIDTHVCYNVSRVAVAIALDPSVAQIPLRCIVHPHHLERGSLKSVAS
jgi:hypothetical protein